jgi:hypothetical protein
MTTFDTLDQAYFGRLADYSRRFVAELSVGVELQPLDRILGEIKPKLESRRDTEVRTIDALPQTTVRCLRDPQRAAGLNSVGLLADRLTILVIKECRLRRHSAAKAEAIEKFEIPEICRALSQAEPNQKTYVGKISAIRADACADSWASAYYGLLTANLLLWEAQEVLYVHDIQALPAEEIRAYIRWFSIGNMLRNEYIELCERLYWRSLSPGATS